MGGTHRLTSSYLVVSTPANNCLSLLLLWSPEVHGGFTCVGVELAAMWTSVALYIFRKLQSIQLRPYNTIAFSCIPDLSIGSVLHICTYYVLMMACYSRKPKFEDGDGTTQEEKTELEKIYGYIMLFVTVTGLWVSALGENLELPN